MQVFHENTLEGKTCVVTGGSRGIGRTIALALAQHGGRVAINYDSDDEGAEVTRSLLGKITKDFLIFKANVTDPDQINEMFKNIHGKFGDTHILVNNAGINRDKSFRKMSKKEWDEVLNVNLTGVFNCTKGAVESMINAKWGRIINISSVIGQFGNFGQANYSAAKAGMIGFTKSLARELALKQITVNAIAPGYINTSMTENIALEIKEKIDKRIAFEKFGEPTDVANMVLMLVSDGAGYITGQVFNVDGGYFG